MSSVVAAVLAHYGGIDEIGIFVVPAVAVILVLRWAERRASRQSGTGGEEESPFDTRSTGGD